MIENVYLQPFLSIGGDYDTFWKLTPKTIAVFFKAYQEKEKEQIRMAWLQGKYIQQALASTIMVCTLADKKIAKQMNQYPEMPYQTEEMTKEMKEQEKHQKQLDLAIKMEKWMKFNNKK